MSAPSFSEQLKAAPARPGCYLFTDAQGEILYVGKAIDLRKRVQVYRREGADGRARLAHLLDVAAHAEFRVTDNELEALLLEEKLVKLHQPRLNVLLKDDKSSLLVHLDTTHQWPRLGLARRRGVLGEIYGPYPSATAARRAKRLLQKAFGLRDCSDHVLAHRRRPCLHHSIGLCSAPCIDAVSPIEYAEALQGAREVLDGQVDSRVQQEKLRMTSASANLEYEVALRARNRIDALELLAAPQKVSLQRGEDFDVLGLDERGAWTLLEYRDGEWLHSRHGSLEIWSSRAQAVEQIISAAYRRDTETPPEILTPVLPDNQATLETHLKDLAGRKVQIVAPMRGKKRALVRMATSNARARKGLAPQAPWSSVGVAVGAMAQCAPPRVVDCIDISHLQGTDRVASKVRFVEGKRQSAAYRRYLVGGGVGNDDFEGMREVLGRVLARAQEDGLPDLMVLDGGRPQLNAVLAILKEADCQMPVVALAKARKGRGPVQAEERLFLMEQNDPVLLERGSPERLFFERLRHEAHRFAIHYHRNRRENVRLVLEHVPGVGPAKRKMLLDACGADLKALQAMSLEHLAAMPGMNEKLAAAVQKHLSATLGT